MTAKYDTEAMKIYKNRIWFAPMQPGRCCSYDIDSGLITYYPDMEWHNEIRAYTNAFLIGSKLYFTPGNSGNILQLGFSDDEVGKNYLQVEDGKYRTSFQYQNKIFLFKRLEERKLFVVNTENGSIEETRIDVGIGDIAPQVAVDSQIAYIGFYDS